MQIQGILSAVQDSIQGNLRHDRQREAGADGAGQSALSGPFLTPAKEDLVEAERQLLQEVGVMSSHSKMRAVLTHPLASVSNSRNAMAVQ